MEAHGISVDDRDAFVEHAVNFDLDDNGYLKKAELEEAAKAWNDSNESTEADTAEESSDEHSEDANEGGKDCPVCPTKSADDATTCVACGFSFVDCEPTKTGSDHLGHTSLFESPETITRICLGIDAK